MRYLRLLATQLRVSMALGMQYRWEFFIGGLITLVWIVIGLVPLYVALGDRPPIEGWTFERALVVVGWFTLLKGVLDGAVNPSLLRVVEQIRQGTLDFTLLKPADAQFLVSTAKFEPWKVIDVGAAMVIFAFAFSRLGRTPAAADVALSLGLLAAATLVLYSVWILVISAAFWVVRLDNLAYLFNSIFDFARWPVTMFSGVWRIIFTVIIPLALMTTYPALALLGALSVQTAAFIAAGAIVFAMIARAVWRRAIAHYTSASS
ncbi:ABC transporter permease [Chondromyces crocatus]|uniref:ABC transporter permease n=1 Tax=Chondromyces crocatus TaxID=52 RepID=A0A0K1EQ83_CHOCO|nr:ABC-2 family transporter protein [Chondromyces crocatus]AKT42783.1 ABC transporter permease [Chondromyces crocatus]